jgi:hypothetical protein
MDHLNLEPDAIPEWVFWMAVVIGGAILCIAFQLIGC